MNYEQAIHHPHHIHWDPGINPSLAVIGCGGTGSALAETLCRMLTGTAARLTLVDPDEVEPHNLLRQNFLHQDLGRPKAQALAERLSQQYQRPIGYSLNDVRHLIRDGEPSPWDLTICCVDNALARAAVHQSAHLGSWILDTGNGREQGQVLLGNISREAHLSWQNSQPTSYFADGLCLALPAPATQLPELLVPGGDEGHHRDRDCAQAILLSEQSPLVNQAVALAAAQFVYKLFTNACRSMAVYLDLNRGTVATVPATPANAARHLQVHYPHHLME